MAIETLYINNYFKFEWIKHSNQKTDWLNGLKKKKRPINMLFTRDPLQAWRHIQTETERMEKYIPCERKSKETQSSNSHFRQTRP